MHIAPQSPPEADRTAPLEPGVSFDELVALAARADCEFQVHPAAADCAVRRTGFCMTEIPQTLVLAASLKWLRMAMESPHVAGIITTAAVLKAARQQPQPHQGIITCEQADELFYFLHNQALHERIPGNNPADLFLTIPASARVHSSAVLVGDVVLAEGVSVGPGCVILGPARIGPDTVIEANCSIGGDGVFRKSVFGRSEHIRHYGGVRIGANCHIHATVAIAKGVNVGESTHVGDDVTIGPHSIVGHDCRVADRTVIAARGSILGRVTIGEDCWIGAGAIVSNPVSVGSGSKVRLGAVVVDDLEPDSDVSGNFARPHSQFLKEYLSQRRAA